MKKLLFLLLPFTTMAQTYFPMREGAILEYRYYDNKGRALKDAWRNDRWTRLTVEKMWGDSVANVAIENETFERLKDFQPVQEIIAGLSYGDVAVRGDGVVFENVMWPFVPEWVSTMGEYKEDEEGHFEITVNSTARLPRVLNVGDTLPEAKHEAVIRQILTPEIIEQRRSSIRRFMDEMAASGHDTRAMESAATRAFHLENIAVMRNRRVVGREMVEGYDCWKIAYEMIGPRDRMPGMVQELWYGENGEVMTTYFEETVPQTIKYIDYLSPEVGLVRREKMNGTGRRVEEVMTLTFFNGQ